MAKPVRRSRPLPDLGMEPTRELTPLEMCPAGEDLPDEYVVELDTNNKIVHNARVWRGHKIKFALIHLYRHNGEWHEVARVDTCHGTVHVHLFEYGSTDDRRWYEIGDASSFEALQVGYRMALDWIYASVEDNVRQWIRG